MENKTEIRSALLTVRDKLIGEFEHYDMKLTSQLRSIIELIDAYTPKSDIEKKDKQSDLFEEKKLAFEKPTTNRRKLKAVQAAKKLFVENPNQEVSPPDLRDLLKELRESGELANKGKNLLVTSHTAIRVLLKQKFVEKIQENPEDDPTYKLKK